MQRISHIDSQFVSQKESLIKVTIKDRVALVELNPPTKLIFLTKPLIKQLNEELFKLEKDPAVAVVIITGK